MQWIHTVLMHLLGYADDVVVIEKGGQEGVPRLTKGVIWVEDRN